MGQPWLGDGVTLIHTSLCGFEVLLLGDGSPGKSQEEGEGLPEFVKAWRVIPGHSTVCCPFVVRTI